MRVKMDVLYSRQNDLELSELILITVEVLFPIPEITFFSEIVNGFKSPGSRNLD